MIVIKCVKPYNNILFITKNKNENKKLESLK